jgi:hypothetical protein
MKESDFPPGTRFFVDEGEPVSGSPTPSGIEFTNWYEGRPVVVSEFGRNSPPSRISFSEFAKRVERELNRSNFSSSPDAHFAA